MHHLRLIAASSLLLLNQGCFKGPPDTYSPETRLAIEAGGPVARVLTYGAPSPTIGQCADSRGGELLPYVCDDRMTKTWQGQVLDSGELLLRLPRGRFRYYSRLTSLEVVGNAKVKGTGEAKGRTAVATYSMVAEWSRYVNVSNLSPVKSSAEGALLGVNPGIMRGNPSLPLRTAGEGERDPTIGAAGSLQKATETLRKQHPATVFGVDLGVGVRVVLDVTVRDIDAEGAVSFGFGELAASIVSDGAEINVRYDTVGVREDILPPNAPTNITSINDLVNVQRAFYGAIDQISKSWNDAYEDAALEGDESGTETTGGADEDKAFDERVKRRLKRKFQIEPAAYYIYRENRDQEIRDICDRQMILYRLSKKRWVSRSELGGVRKRCLCEQGVDVASNCRGGTASTGGGGSSPGASKNPASTPGGKPLSGEAGTASKGGGEPSPGASRNPAPTPGG